MYWVPQGPILTKIQSKIYWQKFRKILKFSLFAPRLHFLAQILLKHCRHMYCIYI